MEVLERIKHLIDGHPIVLFMKGTPQFPMCGFSSRASQALKEAGAQVHAVNILADAEIRSHLPQYSDWPTFPQLFIRGELVGGCDIVEDLHQRGVLSELVRNSQA